MFRAISVLGLLLAIAVPSFALSPYGVNIGPYADPMGMEYGRPFADPAGFHPKMGPYADPAGFYPRMGPYADPLGVTIFRAADPACACFNYGPAADPAGTTSGRTSS